MATKKGYIKANIVENTEIGNNVYKMVLKGSFEGKPGQFYMLKSWKGYPLLARPLSICDKDEDSITFLYLVVGKGTEILKNLGSDSEIELLGPLGNGFELKAGKVAIIAGGIGIAPMLYLAKSLGQKFDLYVGFRSQPYFIEAFDGLVENTVISTEDGSIGKKGYITQYIEDKYDAVYVCGPNSFMNAVQKLNLKGKVFLSLEAHMACGIGACLGCSVQTIYGVKRVCRDGPVFQSDEVIFNA